MQLSGVTEVMELNLINPKHIVYAGRLSKIKIKAPQDAYCYLTSSGILVSLTEKDYKKLAQAICTASNPFEMIFI